MLSCVPLTDLGGVDEDSTRRFQFQRVAGWWKAIRTRAETHLRAGVAKIDRSFYQLVNRNGPHADQ